LARLQPGNGFRTRGGLRMREPSGANDGQPVWILPLEVCPAVPAALWLVLGILGIAGPYLWGLPLAVLPVCAVMAVALVPRAPSGWRWLAGFFPLGLGLSWLHLAAPWQTYVQLLPRQECGAQIQAVVVDANYAGDALDWVDTPSRVAVRLRAVRFTDTGDWMPCSGKVLLRQRFPPENLPYGARITATGTFARPPTAVLPGELDYRRHLRNEGIQHLFLVREVAALEGVRGWRTVPAAAYEWRDRCAEQLSFNVNGPVSRDVLLAITWGYDQGLDADVKARFLRSGAIHLFAISGQHVAILASIVLLFARLAQVPLRVRYGALPLLLGIYVFLTGGAPSAVRAWLMLSLWSAGKALLRAQLALNAVALAAIVLLVGNPLCLGQSGFQFSFLIVIVLILGCRLASAVPGVLAERSLWVPTAFRTHPLRRGLWRWAVQGATVSMLAWFGSSGLVAWTNSLFIPGSVLVNAGICCLAWFALLTAVLKALCWPILSLMTTMPDRFLGGSLDVILQGIDALAAAGATPPASFAIVRPALWLVLMYHGALGYLLLRAGAARSRTLAGVAAGAALLAMALPPAPTNHGAVFSGGTAATPVVVLAAPAPLGPVVINPGDYTQGRMASTWLTTHGWDTVDTLILSGTDSLRAGGMKPLSGRVETRTLILPARGPYGATVQENLQAHAKSGGRARTLSRPERTSTASGVAAGTRVGDLQVNAWRERGATGIEVLRDLPARDSRTRVTVEETGDIRVERTSGPGPTSVVLLRPSLRYAYAELP